MSQVTRQLPVQLSDDETRIKGETLAATIEDYKAAEVEKKNITAQVSKKLKDLRARANELSSQIKNRKEDRAVVCTEEPEYRKGVMQTIRTDTQQVVEERPLTIEERQTNLRALDGGKKAAKAKAGGKDDGGGEPPPAAS